MKFEELGLADSILRAVHAEGYEIATPIQIQAIPPVMKGRDLMGCAQTGTGKTAAFALPTLHLLASRTLESSVPEQLRHEERPQNNDRRGPQPYRQGPIAPARKIRCLVLSPTRELAAQIAESFQAYGKFTGLRHSCVFGGVSQVPQVRDLRFGIDILVATPGRLLDLMEQGYIDLSKVEILILDESDQMLDMGFIQPLRKIISQIPRRRQTLMFSATMPPEIRTLASEWLRDPVSIQVAPVATPAELVQQSVYFVEGKQKPFLLSHYLKTTPNTRTLVFSRTKHGADRIVKSLQRDGIRADAIHGNKSQGARQRVLKEFKSNKPPVLVATDIAARGLDIDAISHVINFELPEIAETYVHRIGRTGRAGATGIAVSFCSREERNLLRQIERLTRKQIPAERPPTFDHPEPQQQRPEGRDSRDNRDGRENRDRREGRVVRPQNSGPRPAYGTPTHATAPAAVVGEQAAVVSHPEGTEHARPEHSEHGTAPRHPPQQRERKVLGPRTKVHGRSREEGAPAGPATVRRRRRKPSARR